MTIRLAEPADAAAIADVHVRAWLETYPGIVPQEELDAQDPAQRRDMWDHILADPERRGFVHVATNGQDRIVGFVAGEASSDTSLIHAIYLLKSAQGSGLGRELMKAVARSLQGAGSGRISLEVARENHGARRFYERIGGTAGTVQACSATENDVPAIEYIWPTPAHLLAGCGARPERN